ncbi:MAG: hypothetical protein RBR22_13845 [Desulfuromonas sp.]|nr:hypothetical protein [Desulfuromonas sp.]
MSDELRELLIGWQEISGYTGVTQATLKVWREQLDFPINRIPQPNSKNRSVATTKTAINEWLKTTFATDGGEYLINKGLV